MYPIRTKKTGDLCFITNDLSLAHLQIQSPITIS